MHVQMYPYTRSFSMRIFILEPKWFYSYAYPVSQNYFFLVRIISYDELFVKI